MQNPKEQKVKVLAYLFQMRGGLPYLLVFEHEGIDAGIQIPAGTVEEGESNLEALHREVLEETGIHSQGYKFRYLGQPEYLPPDAQEPNIRHAYSANVSHLPERWTHRVTGDDGDQGLTFNFYWLSFERAFGELVGEFEHFLPNDPTRLDFVEPCAPMERASEDPPIRQRLSR